jgi:uncharacterized protein
MKKLLVGLICAFAGSVWAGQVSVSDELRRANAGEPFAQNQIGLMYERGEGLPQSPSEAVRFFKLAAAQGLHYAQYNLARLYKRGEGVRQDYVEAIRLWKLAAKQGHSGSQKNLAMIYASGDGTKQDFIKAHMWANLAAADKDEEATNLRETLAKKMSADQIAKAQAMAVKCKVSAYMECDW